MRDVLEAAFRSAVDAAQPARAMTKLELPLPQNGRVVVVGAGKAASVMARAFEDANPQLELSGVVVTRYGHALEPLPGRIRVLEASHPLPDAASVRASEMILETIRDLEPVDLVICLISGGGSALLCAPDGVSLEEKIALTNALLRSGASITEMNVVRKHLSRVKGGRLAQATRARVLSLIVSDVVGDDLSSIASGPTAPDPSTYLEALEVLRRYGIDAPNVVAHLEQGIRGELTETPKPDDPVFQRVENRLIVTNANSLEAAKALLEARGFEARVLSDSVTGESRDAARDHALEARGLKSGEALLSGGETTVTVRGNGRGGRSLEFLLALALELNGEHDVYAIAGDTDGIDGVTDAAGAVVTPDTLARASSLGLDSMAMLEDNDAYSFFEALGDLVKTGPTGTNVNDFRLVVKT